MVNKFWYKDKWDMILEEDNPNSWRDSIGRNFDAYLASGCKDEELVEAVWGCFKSDNPNDWQRHPGIPCDDLSRDHISYALLLFIAARKDEYFNYILDNIKWRINSHTSLRGMYLWTKALRSRRWQVVYHLFKIPGIPFKSLVNHLVRYWAKIQPERSQAEWDISIKWNRTDKQKKAAKLIAVPAYVLHNESWQLHVLPNSPLRTIQQKLLYSLVGAHNYVIKLLLGGALTNWEEELADDYVSMTSSRWTTTLDELNDRHVEIIDPERIGYYDIDSGYLNHILKQLN